MTAASAKAQNTKPGNEQNISLAGNPFLEEWKTPFQVPPFDRIRNEHYLPAFQEGIRQHQAEIDAIVKNPKPATFQNTCQALDQSGKLIEKVSSVFYGLNSANTSKEMQEIAKQVSPIITQHSDDINMNPKLFARVKTIWQQRDKLNLDPQQKKLVEEQYKDFVRGGANLDTVRQGTLRSLNKQINMAQLTFGQNLLAETIAFKLVLDKQEDLAGLPAGLIAVAAETANADTATKGKWVFTLQNPSVIPFLQYSDRRDLRKRIFMAYINRCNNDNEKDNKHVIQELVQLRWLKAKVMGYPDYAAFVLDDRMAKKPENVYDLLNQLWKPALAVAERDRNAMQEMINSSRQNFQLEAWDWRYYEEKRMKQEFDLNEETLRPYFKLENVLQGIFYVCKQLYGITFSEVRDAPKYQEDVILYDCKDADGSDLGVCYMDFYPRGGKRGGAWTGSYRSQSYKDGKRIVPVMTVVTNFTKPTSDKPALLTSDEVRTLFHEFGHNLHGLFKNVKYKGISDVPRDFVELPSQIMENWAFEPEVLKAYARHYQTGEVIPQALVDKITNSRKFGQGFKTTEYLAASFLDMDYHINSEKTQVDVLQFEDNVMKQLGLIPQIEPRYRSTYFQHSMTGGYTAGYYSYIWAEVLDADAFQAFKETGNIFDKATAARFRKDILEKGGSEDAMSMFINFRGRKPSIDALLENRGLK